MNEYMLILCVGGGNADLASKDEIFCDVEGKAYLLHRGRLWRLIPASKTTHKLQAREKFATLPHGWLQSPDLRFMLNDAVKQDNIVLLHDLWVLRPDLILPPKGDTEPFWLHLAAQEGNWRVVWLFVLSHLGSANSSVRRDVLSAKDQLGRSVLYLAMGSGNERLLELLIAVGLNPSHRSHPSLPKPLAYALTQPIQPTCLTIEILMKAGAKASTLLGGRPNPSKPLPTDVAHTSPDPEPKESPSSSSMDLTPLPLNSPPVVSDEPNRDFGSCPDTIPRTLPLSPRDPSTCLELTWLNEWIALLEVMELQGAFAELTDALAVRAFTEFALATDPNDTSMIDFRAKILTRLRSGAFAQQLEYLAGLLEEACKGLNGDQTGELRRSLNSSATQVTRVGWDPHASLSDLSDSGASQVEILNSQILHNTHRGKRDDTISRLLNLVSPPPPHHRASSSGSGLGSGSDSRSSSVSPSPSRSSIHEASPSWTHIFKQVITKDTCAKASRPNVTNPSVKASSSSPNLTAGRRENRILSESAKLLPSYPLQTVSPTTLSSSDPPPTTPPRGSDPPTPPTPNPTDDLVSFLRLTTASLDVDFHDLFDRIAEASLHMNPSSSIHPVLALVALHNNENICLAFNFDHQHPTSRPCKRLHICAICKGSHSPFANSGVACPDWQCILDQLKRAGIDWCRHAGVEAMLLAGALNRVHELERSASKRSPRHSSSRG